MLSFSGLAWNKKSESVRLVLFGFFFAVGALLVGGLGAGLTVLVVFALLVHLLDSAFVALLGCTFFALVLRTLGLVTLLHAFLALVAFTFLALRLHAFFALVAFAFLALVLHAFLALLALALLALMLHAFLALVAFTFLALVLGSSGSLLFAVGALLVSRLVTLLAVLMILAAFFLDLLLRNVGLSVNGGYRKCSNNEC